jgi:hypothetical protein
MPNNQEIYFGACDQMETFIDLATFRRSLVLGILFQGDLAITDVFFFINDHLRQIVTKEKSTRNFIAAGLRNGAIVPVFRSDKNTNFRENLQEIREQEIQGLHPDAGLICDFLETAIKGKRLHYKLWPKDILSLGYRKTLENVFLSDPTDINIRSFEQTWGRTKDLRQYVLGNTKIDSAGGIRRGDVHNAINVFVNKSSDKIENPRSIWENIEDQSMIGDVKRLMKWFSYAYQFNQGKMFGLSPSLASMDAVDLEFSRHLAATAKEDEAGQVWHDEFSVPSETALLTIDPQLVFDVRDSETGAAYFDAVDSWQRHPSDDKSNVLLDRLKRYIAELNRLYVAKGRSIVNWEWHLKAHIPENKIWNRTVLELAKEGAGELIPHLGLLSLVGPLGAATYEWWPASARKGIGINNRVRLEVETRTKRVYLESTSTMDASFK